MSFNRTKYDECALKLDAKRSSDQLDYRIFGGSAENCDQCINVELWVVVVILHQKNKWI